ncbi:hypothetical protein C1T31_06070 [Hanstruepera neustonica]|uniref:DUF2092 domain-containing protein n=1 Tax=Hanstruepera neustonica TaxID=1445657 RepID=A0A2K1E0U9_9FLAO|nr:DUF2092 domain-containing protein [Hanstruepera neustonica]PNQ73891.1 hypothetical protein C1T31_06070 [Hanstruepera neustonica]
MKNYFLLFCFLFFTIFTFSQVTKDHDSTAIFILDKMADVIGDLESVSFDLNSSTDKMSSNNEIEKHYSKSTVSFSGPNKLMAKIDGSKGSKGLWYDGEYLSYYNFDENNYVILEAPETTLEMIDEMHINYDFQFPAADFFYPNFTDDMMEQFDTIKFLGKKMIGDEACYHIMATNSDLNVQLWISNKTYVLPKHFVMIYKKKSNLQYEATFSNWSLNPNIPDSVFDFLPPPNASLISILKKS